MLLKKCVVTMLLFVIAENLHAQQSDVIFKGEIQFEKKVQIVKAYGRYNYMTQEKKDTLPEYKHSYFNLYFDSTRTLYQPSEKETNFKQWEFPAEDNTVFSDLKSFNAVSSKRIEKNQFLFNDNIRKLNWKKTDEVVTIAGFQCKKANAALWDSVIVVAYYTEDIKVAGGPESFAGLPGMVLGIEIPDEYISIYATKVIREVDIAKIKKPIRGIPVSYKELDQKLKPILATYGKDAEMYRKGMFL